MVDFLSGKFKWLNFRGPHFIAKFYWLNFSGKLVMVLNMGPKLICQPQTAFFPLIKVSPQFLRKGISSLKPLILRTYKV